MATHWNLYISLLFPLGRHALANLFDKPALEVLTGFDGTSSYDQGVRIESIDHFVEKKPQPVRLDAENIARERIALVRHTSHQLGGFVKVTQFCQLVAGIARKKERQKRF